MATGSHPSRSAYDQRPSIPLPPGTAILRGPEAWQSVRDTATERAGTLAPLIVIDTYPGVDLIALKTCLADGLPGYAIIDVEDEAALPIDEIDRLIEPNLTDDRVFGVLSHTTLSSFYDAVELDKLSSRLAGAVEPTVIVGWGASLALDPQSTHQVLVLADMARWELQLRQRAGAPNWRCHNHAEDNLRKYKRGFFVEWRVADRHKRALLEGADFFLDANAVGGGRPISPPGLITGGTLRNALRDATSRPFRVVPFFDPGVWGGQWMKRTLELDPSEQNYAWCFDCVPEENSLLLEADGDYVQLPAMDLVLRQPRELLGQKTFARFGAEFPIRFDFLDTVEGGNLSLQVHPLTDYIQATFGMHYTQDESYYILDAGADAVVYLGLREGVDPEQMMTELRAAETGSASFDTRRYVNVLPARKHDHFAIPAGTVHCSGVNSMVLEISATPYIFTFKLWDWGRVGLDGVPRPVHLDHGARNVQWDRDAAWVRDNLLGQVEELRREPGLIEERTGLHELEFIEVRRHWFENQAAHDTDGTVNVLNLVEGDEVEVVSTADLFEPFTVHYAETFIVPAAVGAYVIRRTAKSRSPLFATVKAYVRGTRNSDE